MNGLYFQPSPNRSNDDSLPTAPDQGTDVSSLINQLINRIESAERKIEYKVDSNALAKILLTDRDIVIQGDQVNIVGQLNIADWVRDISGNIVGGIDPGSLTRITAGKVQTGILESFNWSTTDGSQINLDNGTIVTGGSVSPKFSVSSSGVLTCQEAVVTGTLTAGSFIQGSVQLDDEFGISLSDLAAGVDIQAALDAGVTNILAGVGTDFRLNVNTTDAYVTFQHKDAVFLGTAAAGSNKPALGIDAAGIAIGYNRSSDGTWVTSVAIDASGNAAFLGTLSAGSIITSSVTVSGVALSTISSNAASGKSISDALLVSGTSVLKGVLIPTDSGALKTGSITWNSTTGALTGGTGIAMTEWGIIGANAGSATFSLNALTGAATFLGDISGGANINITGNAVFNGSTSDSGSITAILSNSSRGMANGIRSYSGSSGGNAVYGNADNSSGNGYGGFFRRQNGSSGAAVIGESNTAATGVIATNTSSGYALEVNGSARFGSSVSFQSGFTTNTTSKVTNLNADLLDGYDATQFCSIVPTNSGTCTVSGQGFNLLVTGSLAGTVRTRGISNIVYIENISDRRLKEEIKDEELGLDFINSLRPRSFRMKSDPRNKAHGLIYQEVVKLVGENDNLACLNEDGTGAVDYNGIIAPIIKAIQELSKRIPQ